ncbi:MAG: translation initiation factor IF-2 [Candidatus Synoicihabitans palmerolidicus]|nr:translation initiation factor IF-2 [Candidatus Synoicihabitans palmerolidicus]
MSIRIHELAKKIGMDNKALIALLKERNYGVKSVSSTIDNISAAAVVEEFAKPEAEAPVASAPEVSPSTVTSESKAPPTAPKVNLPPGVFVKSAGDVEREKAEQIKAAAEARAAAAKPAPAPPVPSSSPRPVSSPPTPPPVSRPAPMPIPQAGTRPAPARIPQPGIRPAPTPIKQPGILPAPSAAPAIPAPVAKVRPAPTPVASPPPAARPVSSPMSPPPAALAKGPVTPPATPSAAKPATSEAEGVSAELRTVQVKPPIIVREFAQVLGLKPFKLISELMEQGVFSSMNQNIDEPVAIVLAEKHNVILEIKHRGESQVQQQAPTEQDLKKREEKAAQEEEKNLEPRPPVVCILGHVDHGKTSLLDTIRKANVVSGEAGGITQHIGAYQVENENGKITFLDTPGHAAFHKMRVRGAQVTDIAILVVATDDGFMPQTDEALKYIKQAGVALIVAVNKMDVKGANLDQVKTQMQQRDIAAEDWGGSTITVPVSAIKGDGLDTLLEMIQLQAEVLELKANPKTEAEGIIIESQLEVGRGPLATVIVQRGTLKVGDAIVCGKQWAKVRAMYDDQGENLKVAPPSTPVRVIGWSGIPDSGGIFTSAKNARAAEDIAEEKAARLKNQTVTKAAEPKEVSVEVLFANIAATQAKSLKLVIKSDVYGSAEAVRGILEGIQSKKVSVEIVANEVGLVTKHDVQRASAAGATIIGFNTKLENGVTPQAKHHGVRIETYSIIYELADSVRDMMADMLDPDLKEVKMGAAEVREVFPLAKGFVAGCLVTEGKIIRNASVRLRRGKESVHEGKVQTLKRFKDDANEIRAGLECGIKLGDFNGYERGDVIETFEIHKVRASL